MMSEYDYETDIKVHSQEAEARGIVEGERRGIIVTLYTRLGYSVKEIAEEVKLSEKAVEQILQEKGLLKSLRV